MLNHMTGLGHADPGPSCDYLPAGVKKRAFAQVCRELGIEPGKTWVLEVSHEGVLQFTRPLTPKEKAWFLEGRRLERK
jgi:hypothetical protein